MSGSTSIYRFTIGSFNCAVFCDGEETMGDDDPQQRLSFVNASSDEVMVTRRAYTEATGDPADRFSMNILLVDTSGHHVLIDTGLGPTTSVEGHGNLLRLLDAAGVSASDIDTVINTHGHADHVGANTDGHGVPTFPNAHYFMSDVEWETRMREPRDSDRAQILAIAGRFERVAMDAEIVPGIRAIPARGHTLGQIGLLIESNGERLLHTADAFHHPVELYHPEWYFSFDADPDATVSTRRRLFDLAARENLLVLPYHFPFPGLGYIETEGAHWTWRAYLKQPRPHARPMTNRHS